MSRVHTEIDSPIGTLTLVATEGRLCGIYLTGQRHRPDDATFGQAAPESFSRTRTQLAEYFAGQRRTFDLPLTLDGTAFQRAVWQALRDIPYGETRPYGVLAVALGRPNAARAVGLANGKNPLSIIVPCHRLVGSDGSLTGYGGGLARKRYLLDLERGAGSQAWIGERAGRVRAGCEPASGRR